MRKLLRRIYFLLNRRRLERELAEEMAAHREMMPSDRRSHFGSTARLHEDTREVWRAAWLDQLWQDLGYGARMLVRSPGFTLGAIAVLALGVGVNLAEFQIFDAIIFHRLQIRDADSALQFTYTDRRGPGLGFPHAAVEFYQAQSHSFDWLVAEDTTFDVILDGDASVRSCLVSPGYFGALGILPAWGRLLDERDWQPGAAPAAVLGYEYWHTRWGADPNVVGRIVHINNRPVQIVGVLPYSFDGLWGRSAAVWLAVTQRQALMPGTQPIEQDFSRASEVLLGKLKPGVSQAAGEAELTSLARELGRRQPRSFPDGMRLHAQPLQGTMSGSFRRSPGIAIFIVMILLVLLSACANLGNMLLARGLVRRREMDIRVAIGASGARVVRQLMTENLLLALLGSAAGLGFGVASTRLLLLALSAPPWVQPRTGWAILAATLLLTMFSAIAFGLPSALQTVRVNQRKARLRQGLIGVQVAVSCLLLIASGVLAHNGILNASIDFAFDYRNMVLVFPQLYGRNLTPAVAQQKLDEFTARFGALPGVDGVTAAVIAPLGGRMRTDTLPGLPHIYRNSVAPSYFAVMRLPVLRGRTFLPGEHDALIVSESAARAIWPDQDAIGKVLTLAGAERTVVGVVKDSGANLVADVDSIEAYLPMAGPDLNASALILHMRGDPAPLLRLIPGSAAALNETVGVTLMRASRENLLKSEKQMATMIGSIGFVATVLAAAGMFALVAFTVAQRTREIGIRMAIGAGSRHILDVLLRQNARPTALGAAAGVILAIVLSRLVRSQVHLQKHDTVDLIGFAGGLACFALIAVLATLSPALRALRIDPSTTLREE